MITVRSILEKKGGDVWSVSTETSVLDALRTMAEKNVGVLIVLNGNRMAGIFSERDYARKVALKGKSSSDTFVRDVMTSDVISVSPEQSIEECMSLMTARRIRHLPVLSNDSLTGMISIGDVVRAVIEDKESTINHLHSYISGSR
jgi:CBS domain-containing protein